MAKHSWENFKTGIFDSFAMYIWHQEVSKLIWLHLYSELFTARVHNTVMTSGKEFAH